MRHSLPWNRWWLVKKTLCVEIKTHEIAIFSKMNVSKSQTHVFWIRHIVILVYLCRVCVLLRNTNIEKKNFGETIQCVAFVATLRFALMTSFEFTFRASLWSSVAPMKYRPAPCFGLTGMSKHQFNDLFCAMRWSKQPSKRAENKNTEQHRWHLVDDLVANFNDHRANFFSLSDPICVDESLSCWYGQGGHWINHGLPQNVAIDRKPENGCEIQNAACGCSGVMLHFWSWSRELTLSVRMKTMMNQMNQVSYMVSKYWKVSSHPGLGPTVLCAQTLTLLWSEQRKNFTGTAFVSLVLSSLPRKVFRSRTSRVLNSTNAVISLPSLRILRTTWILLWMRSCGWIGNTGTSLRQQGLSWREYLALAAAGAKWAKIQTHLQRGSRWQSSNLKSPKSTMQCVVLSTGTIDIVKTISWSRRRLKRTIFPFVWISLSLPWSLSICGWSTMHSRTEQEHKGSVWKKEFYSILAEELIVNSYDSRQQGTRRPRSSPNGTSYQDACVRAVESGCVRAGVLTHLTPVKRLKNAHGEKTSFRNQGRCKECQKKTTRQCSDCNESDKTVFLCATKNRQRCFLDHIACNHAHLDDY